MRSANFDAILLTLVAILGAAAPVAAEDAAAKRLDELVAPVALYPDPLLVLVLTASIEPDQIKSAAGFARVSTKIVAGVNWADSVNELVHYPGVLIMMADRAEWTGKLAKAVTAQGRQVMASIQHYRTRAMAAGQLASDSHQTVTVIDGVIHIVPTSSGEVYRPTYDPTAALGSAAPGAVTFTESYAPEYALYDVDWANGAIYYGSGLPVTTIYNPVLLGGATARPWRARARLARAGGVPIEAERFARARAGVAPVSPASLRQPHTVEQHRAAIARRQAAAGVGGAPQAVSPLAGYARGQSTMASRRRGQRSRASARSQVPRNQAGLAPGTSSYRGSRPSRNTRTMASGGVPRNQMGLARGTSSRDIGRSSRRGSRSRSSRR